MNDDASHLDDLIRDQLTDSGDTTNGWDIPSGKVWDAVSARIENRRRRRLVLWWFFGGLAITALLYFMLHDNLTSRLSPDNLSTITSASGTDGERPQSNESINAAPHVGSAQSSQPNEDPDYAQVSPARTSGARIRSSSVSNANRHRQTHPAFQPVDRKGENTHTRQVPMGEEDIPPALQRRSYSARDHPTEMIMPLNPKLCFLESEPQELRSTHVIPVISRQTSKGYWAISGFAAPSWGTRKIVVPSARPAVARRLLLEEESPVAQVGCGVSVTHGITDRWSLTTGVEYSSFLLNSSATRQIRFTRAGERLNDHGNLENTLDLNFNTSYGELNADVIMERSSSSQFDENQFINVTLNTRQSMQVLEIPVSVKYQFPVGTWQGSLRAGVSANALLENQLKFTAIKALDNDVLALRAVDVRRPGGLQQFAFGYQFGVGVTKALTPHWSMLMEPCVSGYLQPVFQRNTIRIYPVLFDVHVGMQYVF